MKISLEWLKDYIDLSINVDNLKDVLTFSGIEVEDVLNVGALQDSIITAKILDCQLIKDSNHLFVCQVDTGKEKIQVVCGAPNCTNDIIGILALPGTKLGNQIIKTTHLRGVESSGMLCSEKEIGLSDNHTGIMVLPPDTPVGISIKDIIKLPDTIFELEITPNRPDLLGLLGIAQDLSASTNSKLTSPKVDILKTAKESELQVTDYLSLNNINQEMCPRYTAKVFRNVSVGDSPLWLKIRLIKAGLRPINNIVDITNYVMLETGHPLHAFDYDKLHKTDGTPTIVIRNAQKDESFPALDGKTYLLGEDDLVISDEVKAVAIAGIIGGANSHITSDTTNIVLEAACFNHSSVRRTAFKHKISTDSSYRFERQLAPETTKYASARAEQLIIELAGGIACLGTLDDWKNKSKPVIVPIRPGRFKQTIGINLSKEQIVKYLTKLGLIYLGEGNINKPYPESGETIPKVVQGQEESLYFDIRPLNNTHLHEIEPIDEALYFEIPPKRVDLTREIDLIEEVIRLHGMDKVTQKSKITHIMDRHAFYLMRKTADYLVYNGFREVINLSFTEPHLVNGLGLNNDDDRLKQIVIVNPQNSKLSVMRTNLIVQLIQTALYNLNHGSKQLRLFEMNKVFYENSALPKSEVERLSILWLGTSEESHWQNQARKVDFYAIKGIIEGLLKLLGISDLNYDNHVSEYLEELESQRIVVGHSLLAEYGKLKPSIAALFGIDIIELKHDVWIADIAMDILITVTRNMTNVYHTIPRFPSIERDISFLIQNGISHKAIAECVCKTDLESISHMSLIDEYKGKQIPNGFRSLTYRIFFNHPEKTLTDDEVDSIIDLIVKTLKSLWDIQMR